VQYSARGLEDGDLLEEALSALKDSDARLSYSTFLSNSQAGFGCSGIMSEFKQGKRLAERL
jgi:hypothetical protein